MAGDIKAVSVVVRGRVQGVWFRGWMVEEAKARRLRGWVRNRRDGSVEALFAGPASAVDAMVSACRRGPSYARVDDMESTPAAPPAEDGFRSLPTA